MPVLHWDTDRKRNAFANTIDSLTSEHYATLAEEQKKEAAKRQTSRRISLGSEQARGDLYPAASWRPGHNISMGQVADAFSRRRLPSLNRQGKGSDGRPRRDRRGRLLFKKSLAQLLYDAANLMEAMENHRDAAMLETYLFKPSPLHPRRTLDQAYYCSVKNTRVRDRDQVVYRETAPKADGFHHWEYEGGQFRWNCQPDRMGIIQKKRKDNPGTAADLWPRKHTLRKRCKKCGSSKTHKKSWGISQCPSVDEYPTDDNGDGFLSSESENEAPSPPPAATPRTTAILAGRALCRTCGMFEQSHCDRRKPPNGVSTDKKNKVKEVAGKFSDKVLDGRCGKCNSAAFFCPCRELNIPPTTNQPCQICRENICRLSRLVMVDQLWMWILDEHTILTFIPRRYGFNRNDASGIHKLIRSRLESKHSKQVRSVFDLALVVLEECTKTFFDRTRTTDRQPLVLDLFSEAIGRLVGHPRAQRSVLALTLTSNRHTSKPWRPNTCGSRQTSSASGHLPQPRPISPACTSRC
jgi:hypothetical protein